MSGSNPYINLDLSTGAELVIAYALTTVGTDRTESVTIRHQCANALDELRHPVGAEEVRQSLASVKV